MLLKVRRQLVGYVLSPIVCSKILNSSADLVERLIISMDFNFVAVCFSALARNILEQLNVSDLFLMQNMEFHLQKSSIKVTK